MTQKSLPNSGFKSIFSDVKRHIVKNICCISCNNCNSSLLLFYNFMIFILGCYLNAMDVACENNLKTIGFVSLYDNVPYLFNEEMAHTALGKFSKFWSSTF